MSIAKFTAGSSHLRPILTSSHLRPVLTDSHLRPVLTNPKLLLALVHPGEPQLRQVLWDSAEPELRENADLVP